MNLTELLARLDEHYPDPECPLTHESPYQLLVSTILSAQCTDKMVNQVTPGLFARYPTVADLAQADLEELEPIIYRTGFYRNKAKHLKGMAETVVSEFGGEIPATLEELMSLAGVARKTANVLLNVWHKRASGIVVDTHVTRISKLLGLTEQSAPEKIAADLETQIPRDHWIRISLQFIHLGREICVARRPKCGECFLSDLCPSAQV